MKTDLSQKQLREKQEILDKIKEIEDGVNDKIGLVDDLSSDDGQTQDKFSTPVNVKRNENSKATKAIKYDEGQTEIIGAAMRALKAPKDQRKVA